ncbi:hypothetical protein BDV06DRAFT_229582 [Aspergillus oleicola]
MEHQIFEKVPELRIMEKQQLQLTQLFHMVAWQQVFPTRKNSHLVHIRSRDPKPEEPPVPTHNQQQIVAEIKAQATADEQKAARQVAKAGERHEANPWLRITWWARYLEGVKF